MDAYCFTDVGGTQEYLIMCRVLEFQVIVFVEARYKHLRIQNVLIQDFV